MNMNPAATGTEGEEAPLFVRMRASSPYEMSMFGADTWVPVVLSRIEEDEQWKGDQWVPKTVATVESLWVQSVQLGDIILVRHTDTGAVATGTPRANPWRTSGDDWGVPVVFEGQSLFALGDLKHHTGEPWAVHEKIDVEYYV